jgi:hypothetical protein
MGSYLGRSLRPTSLIAATSIRQGRVLWAKKFDDWRVIALDPDASAARYRLVEFALIGQPPGGLHEDLA